MRPEEVAAGPVRVHLDDRTEVVRAGLEAMLSTYADRVVLVDDAEDADLLLRDVPELVGRTDVPPLGGVVVFTWHTASDVADRMMRAGAAGYLSKELPGRELVEALEAVRDGERVVAAGTEDHEPDAGTPLTPREAEIVTLIARGLDNTSIAEEAGLSINSVKSYIRSAYRKMGVSSRSQAVLWGVRQGHLDPAAQLSVAGNEGGRGARC